jgi:hypothetical protein
VKAAKWLPIPGRQRVATHGTVRCEDLRGFTGLANVTDPQERLDPLLNAYSELSYNGLAGLCGSFFAVTKLLVEFLHNYVSEFP